MPVQPSIVTEVKECCQVDAYATVPHGSDGHFVRCILRSTHRDMVNFTQQKARRHGRKTRRAGSPLVVVFQRATAVGFVYKLVRGTAEAVSDGRHVLKNDDEKTFPGRYGTSL